MALGLLLGSDYCPGGVLGVGKKLALQLVREWKRKKSTNLLDRFREWTSSHFKEGMIVLHDVLYCMYVCMYVCMYDHFMRIPG